MTKKNRAGLHVKLLSSSHENDDFLRFLAEFPELEGEEGDEILERYIQWWLNSNPRIEVYKISGPVITDSHVYFYIWYYSD